MLIHRSSSSDTLNRSRNTHGNNSNSNTGNCSGISSNCSSSGGVYMSFDDLPQPFSNNKYETNFNHIMCNPPYNYKCISVCSGFIGWEKTPQTQQAQQGIGMGKSIGVGVDVGGSSDKSESVSESNANPTATSKLLCSLVRHTDTDRDIDIDTDIDRKGYISINDFQSKNELYFELLHGFSVGLTAEGLEEYMQSIHSSSTYHHVNYYFKEYL